MNALNIKNDFFNNYNFSLIILDMDLYKPTISVLKNLNYKDNLAKKGKIVFDEGNSKIWKGENKAMNEFLIKNKKYFTKEIVSKFPFEPNVLLTKK